MADPAARARLNPLATPIRVEIEGGGPLAADSVVHFRLQIGSRIADYRARVLEFVPMRRIVTRTDSAIPFEIRIEVAPEGNGTRLSQTECFEPSEAMLAEIVADSMTQRLWDLFAPLLVLIDPEYALRRRARQQALLTRQLEERLARWLAAIRAHLESAESAPAAP